MVQPAISGWRDGWYVVPMEVSWRDLDAIGHVNNAVYFSYFEWARTKYWFASRQAGTATWTRRCPRRCASVANDPGRADRGPAPHRKSGFPFDFEMRSGPGAGKWLLPGSTAVFNRERNEK